MTANRLRWEPCRDWDRRDWTRTSAAARFGGTARLATQSTTGAAQVEAALLARLRAGDERAFETLVEHHRTMLAVARSYVRTRAIAEEVVQEAWLGVLKGLDRFEGRSSLKTWIMRIVVNIAKTRGVRRPASSPRVAGADGEEPR